MTAGDAIADAIDEWSRGPARVAAVMLWAIWAIGLIALLAPRPWGVTVLRVAAPIAVGTTAAAAIAEPSASGAIAVASALIAAVLVLSSPVVEAAGNALAYGDEQRFALRIPTPLLYAPVPFAIVAIACAGIGPLLIAAEDYVVGAIVLVVTVPLAVVLARSLHSLARRWLVLVPAGLVVVDPLTLIDPVLVRREQIAALGRLAPEIEEVVDLRLGTRGGSVALTTKEPIALGRRAGRTGAAVVPAQVVIVSPIRSAAVLTAASSRRIPVP